MFCIVNTPEIDRLRENYNKKYNDNMTEHQFLALLEAMMSDNNTPRIPNSIAAINKFYQNERQKDARMEMLVNRPKFYEQGFSPLQSAREQSMYAQEQNREMEEIKQRAIADGTFMKAPNGKESNLNERQWLQVRTKAFKDWFGDWENDPKNASKVVDENGEPLVVYHYTDDENLSKFFVEFDNYFAQSGGTKEAIFFTEDNVEPGTEDNFLTSRKKKLDVFLNIRNLEEHHGTKEDLHKQGTTYREVVNKSAEKPGRNNGLKFSGFDDNKKTDQTIWVIHDSNQVKSATDNVGTFSTEDDNIFYSLTSEDGPVKWAQDSDNGFEVSTKGGNDRSGKFLEGDSRFSALNARFDPGTRIMGYQVDGMTVEEVYQNIIKQSGKNKPPKEGSWVHINTWLPYFESGNPLPDNLTKRLPADLLNKLRDAAFGTYTFTPADYQDFSYYMGYLPLWKVWARQHPTEMAELAEKSRGKVLTDMHATTRVSQARALAHILNETSAINQEQSRSNEARQIASTIAPYRRTTYADYIHMSPEERNKMRDAFATAAKNIADLLGIELDMSVASANIGGYQFENGGEIVEPSFTFRMNTTPEKARMFSALMADLGWEQQESVATFMSVDNPEDGNGVRFTIKFSERLLPLLEKHGIKNFTFDKQNEVLSVLSFDEADVQKLYNLTEELNNGQAEKQEVGTAPFFSTLDFEKDRRTLYEEWLHREGGQNPVLDNLVKEALRKVTPPSEQRPVQAVSSNNPPSAPVTNNAQQAPRKPRGQDSLVTDELIKKMSAEAAHMHRGETNEMLKITRELADKFSQQEIQSMVEYIAGDLIRAMDKLAAEHRERLLREIAEPGISEDSKAAKRAQIANLAIPATRYSELFNQGVTPIDIITDTINVINMYTQVNSPNVGMFANMIAYFDPLLRSAFLVTKRRTGIEFSVDKEALKGREIVDIIDEKQARENAAPTDDQLQKLVELFSNTTATDVTKENNEADDEPDNPDEANGDSEAPFFDVHKENPYKALTPALRMLFANMDSKEQDGFGGHRKFDPEFVYVCIMSIMDKDVNNADDFMVLQEITEDNYPNTPEGKRAYERDKKRFGTINGKQYKPTFPAFEKYRRAYPWMDRFIKELENDWVYKPQYKKVDKQLQAAGLSKMEFPYGRVCNMLYTARKKFNAFWSITKDGDIINLNEIPTSESVQQEIVANYRARTTLSRTMMYNSDGKINVENIKVLLGNRTSVGHFKEQELDEPFLEILAKLEAGPIEYIGSDGVKREINLAYEFAKLMDNREDNIDYSHYQYLDADAKQKFKDREKAFYDKRREVVAYLAEQSIPDDYDSQIFVDHLDRLTRVTNVFRSVGFNVTEQDLYRHEKALSQGIGILYDILEKISSEEFLKSGVDDVFAGTDDALYKRWRDFFETVDGIIYQNHYSHMASEDSEDRYSFMPPNEITRIWAELTHMDVERRRAFIAEKWGNNPFMRDQSKPLKNDDGLWNIEDAGWRNEYIRLQWEDGPEVLEESWRGDMLSNNSSWYGKKHEYADWSSIDIAEMQFAMFCKGMKNENAKYNFAMYTLPIFADSPVCKVLGGRRHSINECREGMVEVALQELTRMQGVAKAIALRDYAREYFKAEKEGRKMEYSDSPSQQTIGLEFNPDAEGITPAEREYRLNELRKALNFNEISNLYKNGLKFQFIPELNTWTFTVTINGEKQRINALKYIQENSDLTNAELRSILSQAVADVLHKRYEDYYNTIHNSYSSRVNVNRRAVVRAFRNHTDGSPKFAVDNRGNTLVYVDEGEKYWSNGRMHISRGEWYYMDTDAREFAQELQHGDPNDSKYNEFANFVIPYKKSKFISIARKYCPSNNMYDVNEEFTDGILERMWYNSTFANAQMVELFFGDPAYAKDSNDFQKRWKALYAGGKQLNTNAIDGRKEYNIIILKDNKRSVSNSYDSIFRAFDDAVREGRISKEQRDAWVSSYHNIDATDAQGLRSLESFRRVLKMAGMWGTPEEESYQRIIDGKWTEQDLNFLIQTIKPVYYGTQNQTLPGGMVTQVPMYIKNSEAVLLTIFQAIQVPYSPTMKALDRFQKKTRYTSGKNNGQTIIDAYQYETAVKLGGQGAVDLRYSRTRLKELRDGNWSGMEQAQAKFIEWRGNSDLSDVTYDEIDKWAHEVLDNSTDRNQVARNLRMVNSVLNYLDYSREEDKDPATQEKWENEMVNILDGAVFSSPNTNAINPEVVHQLDYDNMVIQQPTPHHAIDGKVSFGSQLRYLLPIDLPDNIEVEVHGKKYKKPELIEHYNRLMVARALKGYEEANSVFADIHTLQKYLISIVKDNPRYGDDMLNALEIVKWTDENGDEHETFALPNTSVNMSNKLEELLTAVYRNKVHRQKMHGGSTIIMADMKFSNELRVRFDEHDNLEGVECYLPAAAKGIIATCGRYNHRTGEYVIDPKKMQESGLDKIIGYRIPSDDKHSLLPLIVKGFLPPAMGSAIIVSKEIITMTGGDNDVDKCYLFTHHYKVHKGQMEKVLYDESKAENENSLAQIENEIIDVAHAILTNRKVSDKLFKPQDFETVRKTAMVLQVIKNQEANAYAIAKYREKNGSSKPIDWFNLGEDVDGNSILKDAYKLADYERSCIYPQTYIYYHEQNSSGKAEVGIFANNSALNAKLQDKHIKIKGAPIRINGREISELSPMTIEVNGQKIRVSDTCSEVLGAAVDTAKDPLLAKLGITKDNAAFAGFLLRMGLTVEEMGMFMAIYDKHGRPDVGNYIKQAMEEGKFYSKPVTTDMMLDVFTMDTDTLRRKLNSLDNDVLNVLGTLERLDFLSKALRDVTSPMQADSPNHAMETDFASAIYYKYQVEHVNRLIRDEDFPFEFPRDEKGEYQNILPINGEDDFESIMKSKAPVTQAYHTLGISKALEHIGSRYVVGSPMFDAWMRQLEPYLFSMRKENAVRCIRALYREFITFYLSRLPLFDQYKGEDGNFLHNKQFYKYYYPNEFKKYATKKEYGVANNVALSRIQVDEDGHLVIDTSQISDMVKPYIFAGLDSLWDANDSELVENAGARFAQSLLIYSYFANGLVFAFNDPSNFFSVDFLTHEGHFDGYIELLAQLEQKLVKNDPNDPVLTPEESQRFFIQFMRNNASRFDLGIKIKQDEIPGVGFPLEASINKSLAEGTGPIYHIPSQEQDNYKEGMFYRLPADEYHSHIYHARMIDGSLALVKIADALENEKIYHYQLSENDLNKKEAWYHPNDETTDTWDRPKTDRQRRKEAKEAKYAEKKERRALADAALDRYLAGGAYVLRPDTNDTTSNAQADNNQQHTDDRQIGGVDFSGADDSRAELTIDNQDAIARGMVEFDEQYVNSILGGDIDNRIEASMNRAEQQQSSVDGLDLDALSNQAKNKMEDDNQC